MEQTVLTCDQVRAVDRNAIEVLRIPGVVLMENAARGLLATCLELVGDRGRFLVACGPGNNGGDGYALARLLVVSGHDVVLTATGAPRPGSDAAINAEICRRMNIATVATDAAWPEVDVVVDALFGTGLARAIEGTAAVVVDRINAMSSARVMAVDIPSGLDGDTGVALGPAVRADVTVTFVAAKSGLVAAGAGPFVGRVVVASIGAPVAGFDP